MAAYVLFTFTEALAVKKNFSSDFRFPAIATIQLLRIDKLPGVCILNYTIKKLNTRSEPRAVYRCETTVPPCFISEKVAVSPRFSYVHRFVLSCSLLYSFLCSVIYPASLREKIRAEIRRDAPNSSKASSFNFFSCVSLLSFFKIFSVR